MSVLDVDSINRYFYAKISDKTIHDARKIGVAKLIEANTTVEKLIIRNVPDSKKIDLIFEGLKNNTYLKDLDIKSFGDGRVPFPNCGVKHLSVNYASLSEIPRILSCTTLDTLTIRCLFNHYNNKPDKISEFGTFIQNFNIKRLCIYEFYDNFSSQICENIFMNEHIKSLEISSLFFRSRDFNTIAKILSQNTKLETLSIISVNSICYVNELMFLESLKSNKSIIDFKITEGCSSHVPKVNEILMRNLFLRWNFIRMILIDLVIAMFPLRIKDAPLPPYVLLEIFDWIYPDNPYSTHFKKINLIIDLYRSIKEKHLLRVIKK